MANDLKQHATRMAQCQLRELLKDEKRCDRLMPCHDGITIDASRQLVDMDCLNALIEAYKSAGVEQKIENMFAGEKINGTEKRSVLHVALRAEQSDKIGNAGDVDAVLKVRAEIKQFTDKVRTGKFTGHTGKTLTNVVCVGIGGSYLGVEFVHEALRTEKNCAQQSNGRTLRFLANVDPIDVTRALEGLNLEETLVVIISKTFTTAETIMNARTVRDRFVQYYKGDEKCVSKHFCAVSTNLEATGAFGLSAENVFGFWDWVGGRFSVCSAVGMLPLSLQYGYEVAHAFLKGARSMDMHFREEKDVSKNLPAMMGLLSFFNSTYMDLNCVAVLPYCQALLRFPAHIQQLTMESNGKRVSLDGKHVCAGANGEPLTGEIYFGEPGTNGQHSFYQLVHQGRKVACEFIGFTKSQTPCVLEGEAVSNHDELMSNFFAQPDALALGKNTEDLQKEGVVQELIPHKTFPGNRVSTCILFKGHLDPYKAGQLLALYEHRTAVQGFLWGINSFDQWGVELGKVLAKKVRNIMAEQRASKHPELSSVQYSTGKLINSYFA